MIRLLVLALVLLSGCASANWTQGDSIRQGAIVALQTADYLQTRTIAVEMVPESYTERPNGSSERFYAHPRWRETNPMLGEHPTTGQVNIFFAAGIIGNAVISYALPPRYRAWWQAASIGLEGYYVGRNYQAGIRW